MKDTEIHNGLENKEIRDFLSKSIVDANNININKTVNCLHDNAFDNYIEAQRCIIENANALIQQYEIFKAVKTIANNQNWKEFDVSDFVKKTDNTWCRTFFGTEIEYDNLIIKITL